MSAYVLGMTTNTSDAATLYIYRTGEPLRAATADELARSNARRNRETLAAFAKRDERDDWSLGGDVGGVILVEIDGIEVPCYAMATT